MMHKNPRLEVALLVGLLLASLAIRWKNATHLPYGIEQDELAWTATALFHQHGITAADRGLWSMHDALAKRFPVSLKINQLSFILFGPDMLSPRKMLVILSTFSLLFFYILARKFLSPLTSLVTLALFSFSTYKLICSRIPLPGVATDVFVFPAIAFLLNLNFKRPLFSYVMALLSGSALALTLLTYNLAYLMVPVAAIVLLFISIKQKITLKHTFLLSLLLLIPLVLTAPIWFKSALQETSSKAYVLNNSAINLETKQVFPEKISANCKAVHSQLFDQLTYPTQDMLIAYPAPLLPRIITLGAIIGFIFALFNLKDYLPLVIWLLVSSAPYHLLLGLYLPRMWIISVPLLYLLAGVTLHEILNHTRHFHHFAQLAAYVVLLGICGLVISSSLNLYHQHALGNPAFLPSHRELVDLVKNNRAHLGENLFLIPQKSDTPTNHEVAFATVSFYFLAEKPRQVTSINTLSRQNLGVLTKTDFLKEPFSQAYCLKTIIVSKSLTPLVEKTLDDNCQNSHAVKNHKYFTKITVLPVTR